MDWSLGLRAALWPHKLHRHLQMAQGAAVTSPERSPEFPSADPSRCLETGTPRTCGPPSLPARATGLQAQQELGVCVHRAHSSMTACGWQAPNLLTPGPHPPSRPGRSSGHITDLEHMGQDKVCLPSQWVTILRVAWERSRSGLATLGSHLWGSAPGGLFLHSVDCSTGREGRSPGLSRKVPCLATGGTRWPVLILSPTLMKAL